MDAHDVEFRFGINDRQVCTALTLHVPSTLTLPCGTLHALTSQSSPLDCPLPCAQDFYRLRHFLSNEISLRAGGVDARARGAGSAPRRAMCLLLRAMRPRATVGAFHGTVRVSLVGWCCELALGACAL